MNETRVSHSRVPVIVLNSGRCGSTMISNIIREHPRILSISEFFRCLGETFYDRHSIGGKGMWKKLSQPSPSVRMFLRNPSKTKEILYPFDAEKARFTPDNIPPIMAIPLPHMTTSFESLYNELESTVSKQPRQSMSDHYRSLFGHMCDRFDRDIWVERSGASLQIGAKLLHLFPDARVVHLVRDGRDTALSMSRHHGFRLIVGTFKLLTRYKYDVRKRLIAPMYTRTYRMLINIMYSIPQIGRIIESEQVDLEDFGHFWSLLELTSQEFISLIPRENYLQIRFEDILEKPRETIAGMVRFMGPNLVDESWLDRVQTIPRPISPRYLKLDVEERKRLTLACAPGLEALGYSYDL